MFFFPIKVFVALVSSMQCKPNGMKQLQTCARSSRTNKRNTKCRVTERPMRKIISMSSKILPKNKLFQIRWKIYDRSLHKDQGQVVSEGSVYKERELPQRAVYPSTRTFPLFSVVFTGQLNRQLVFPGQAGYPINVLGLPQQGVTFLPCKHSWQG